MLVDALSTCLHDLILDPGKEFKALVQEDEDFSYTESIILKLVEGMEDQNKILFIDNCYSSINLAEKLFDKNILLSAALRTNSKDRLIKIHWMQVLKICF